MKYLIARFQCSPNTEVIRDLLADIAGDAGFEAFEETDQGLNGYVQQDLLDRNHLDESISQFPIADATITYELDLAESRDWNETWENQGFDPIVIDNRCVVYDARRPLPDLGNLTSESNRKSAETLYIAIDARLAFGTGTHETTRMMLTQLLSTNVKGKRVLDCGCGTGILGIAASKLGAASIVAYDIDEWSVSNAIHNADINLVNNMEVLLGNAHVLSHVSGLFDVVLANINRNILLADMPAFKDVMAPGARLILSGFYEEDIPQLVAKASEVGLEYQSKLVHDGWSCIVLG